MAAAAAEAGAALVLPSTDYVFDGRKGAPYDEDDAPAPLGAYGRTKLAGERAALARHPGGTRVARTAWLYGAGGRNFVNTMRRLGAEREEVEVVDDQTGSPTWTRDLAPALEALLDRPAGVYHAAGGGAVTWAGLARAVFEETGCRVPGAAGDDRGPRPAGPPAALLGPRQRSPGRAAAARLARGPRRLPGGARVRLLVTGGCGFIGSAFVRLALARGAEVVNLDKLTYAGNPANVAEVADEPGYSFVHADIADAVAVRGAIEGVDAVVNLAAESHVDRSILDPADFIRTDVVGTAVLLDAARGAGVRRFVQVSTDEVYGSIASGAFAETDPISPSSPYSASKAGGDLQVLAWHRTYGLDAVVTRGSNTFGPRQYPEKLIPLFVTNALDGETLPVYGDGLQVRDWIHVDDHCEGIWAALERGAAGEVYNVGGGNEVTNLELTRRHPGADRRRRVADPPRHRPPRPRPPLRPRHRPAAGAGLGAAPALRRGAGRHGRLVPRAAGLVGADQERRVPALLRAPVRRRLSAPQRRVDGHPGVEDAGQRQRQCPGRAAGRRPAPTAARPGP